MKTTLESLMAAGAFSKAGLIEETVKLANDDGEVEFTVFVRPLSYRSALSEIAASQQNKDALAARIASSICDEDGRPIFTIEDITGEADPERGPLSNDMTIALLDAISRANGLGKRKNR